MAIADPTVCHSSEVSEKGHHKGFVSTGASVRRIRCKTCGGTAGKGAAVVMDREIFILRTGRDAAAP